MAAYSITGRDQKEQGPFSTEQVRQLIAQGDIDPQTEVQADGSGEWRPCSDFPEFGEALSARLSPPPILPPAPSSPPGTSRLAIASLVLGILGLVSYGLTALVGLIVGIVARRRIKRSGGRLRGSALASAGIVVSVCFAVLGGMVLPALAAANAYAKSIGCINNMKQIGLAFRVWATDHEDRFPFNVPAKEGGTMEFTKPDGDGFDESAPRILQVLSNELRSPKLLVCPSDSSKRPAIDFSNLSAANVSYRVRSGTNVTEGDASEVLARCPVHDTEVCCDGTVIRHWEPPLRGGRR
jgi:hypothetical protein